MNDIIAVGTLIFAYTATWALFLGSLRIVRLIDEENLKHARQIQDRLGTGEGDSR